MTNPKGVSSKVSGYLTHNFCSHCYKWLPGKPRKCPSCKMQARSTSKYVKHKVYKRIG